MHRADAHLPPAWHSAASTDLKLVIVRSDGTVNVQAIVLRNVNAEPIERDDAKRPPQRSIDSPLEVVSKALGMALGGCNLIRAAIECKGTPSPVASMTHRR